jgi:hypothetical protein
MTTAAAASIPARAARRLGRWLSVRHALRVELVLRQGRRRLTRLVGLAYPAFIVFVIVATGNHFLLDAAAGALVVALAAGMTALLLRRPAAEPMVLRTRRRAPAPDQLAA